MDQYNRQEKLTPERAASTLDELIRTLRLIHPSIDHTFYAYESVKKKELVAFMEAHFCFNISIADFSYLTGRSISAFNRDFRKAFGKTPLRWLTQKRLELAHQQLTTLKQRPAEVYRQVGFADLSHFSFAFKRSEEHTS